MVKDIMTTVETTYAIYAEDIQEVVAIWYQRLLWNLQKVEVWSTIKWIQ